jgi:hypothetical protein
MEFFKKIKWFLLASFIAGFFSNFFVRVAGLEETAFNTALVVFILLLIPTIIFIVQNKKKKDKVPREDDSKVR